MLLVIFSAPDFVFFPESESVYVCVWTVYQCVQAQNTKTKLDLPEV